MTKTALFEFLRTQNLGVLGSLGEDGRPQSALMGIAITTGFEIVFDTVRATRKYPNLIARPACSFVIGGWNGDQQTVQYEGDAAELESPSLERYLEVYFTTWPDGPSRKNWPGMTYFVVRPRWIRYSSFNEGQRMIAEFEFPPVISGK